MGSGEGTCQRRLCAGSTQPYVSRIQRASPSPGGWGPRLGSEAGEEEESCLVQAGADVEALGSGGKQRQEGRSLAQQVPGCGSSV